MLNLTKKIDYGLELALALARHYDQPPLSLRQVADQQRIPYLFLSQVAVSLRRAGLIEAKEGSGGGYFLACPPAKITLSDVVDALSVSTVDHCEICEREGLCHPRHIWAQIEKHLNQKLRQQTLKDLIKN